MKDKMRCASCGAMFKPSRSSQTKCDRCEKREREQRAAARHAGEGGPKAVTVTQAPVRISGPAAGLIGGAPAPSDPPAAPPVSGGYGMAAWREEERRAKERQAQELRDRERAEREQQRMRERTERERFPGQSGSHPRPTGPGQSGSHTYPGKQRPLRGERPAQPPKPPRPPKAAPPKVELTDDLRANIEARYLELAQPIEFDGIRTRIATELSLPKALVKKAVSDLRSRMSLPSWWDLQAFTGAETDLERIRMAYVPLLPAPEVGVHKTLAVKLNLDPRAVYQGIRRIRAEMRLPQYNPPSVHGDEPASEASPEEASASPTPPAADSRD